MVSASTRRAVHVLGGLYRMQERVAGNDTKKTREVWQICEVKVDET